MVGRLAGAGVYITGDKKLVNENFPYSPSPLRELVGVRVKMIPFCAPSNKSRRLLGVKSGTAYDRLAEL